MSLINRRNALRAIAASAIVTTSACATFDPTVGQVSSDVALVATGLQGALQQLGSIPSLSISAAALSTAGSAIASLQALAAQVAQASSVAAQQPLIQKIATYAGTVLSVLTPAIALIPGAQGVAAALAAVQVLLPVILAAVGLALPASAAPSGMTSGEARLILRGSAATVK
jgi:hypothetical protein